MSLKHTASVMLAALLCVATNSLSAQAVTPIVMPPAHVGSFFTLSDYLPNGKLVAFDGFTVYVEDSRGASSFTAIGSLPPQYQGATDPGFIIVSPDGQSLILSGGGGGSKFPDPAFNGTIFRMPISGGTATLLGLYPFNVLGKFMSPNKFAFGQGETFGSFTGSVELLDLTTLHKQSIVGPIPGDPGGIAFDHTGNLYVGLAAGQVTSRTGEVHRFTRYQVAAAILNNTPLDFDSDGVLVTQVLSAADLGFSAGGQLFVGGANFNGGPTGFIAEVNPYTGAIIKKFDPVDGNPNDGTQRFFGFNFSKSQCVLAAEDLDMTGAHTVYPLHVCDGE